MSKKERQAYKEGVETALMGMATIFMFAFLTIAILIRL